MAVGLCPTLIITKYKAGRLQKSLGLQTITPELRTLLPAAPGYCASAQGRCLQVMKNAVLPPSKRSTVERQMDLVILFMFALLFAMCIANAACFAVWTQASACVAYLLTGFLSPFAYRLPCCCKSALWTVLLTQLADLSNAQPDCLSHQTAPSLRLFFLSDLEQFVVASHDPPHTHMPTAHVQTLTPSMWYLATDSAPPAYDPDNAPVVGVYSFIASFVLYGYLIPISLYVSLEMVKVIQVRIPARPWYPNCEADGYCANLESLQAMPLPSPMFIPTFVCHWALRVPMLRPIL